jgi:hypothetical protein
MAGFKVITEVLHRLRQRRLIVLDVVDALIHAMPSSCPRQRAAGGQQVAVLRFQAPAIAANLSVQR